MRWIDIFRTGSKNDDLDVYDVASSGDERQVKPQYSPPWIVTVISEWMDRLRLPQDTATRMLAVTVVLAILASIFGWIFYGKVHTYDSYRISKSADRSNDKTLAGLAEDPTLVNTVGDLEQMRLDVDGTSYTMLGKRVIKYSHDGVFCVNMSNETLWSIAYSIQTPICSQRGGYMVIAEQQGNQVYVLNEKGLVGNFATGMPILKVDVSENGVTSIVQKDEGATWINLYDTSGNTLSSIMSTLGDTGFPLDSAISDNGKKLAVSYACVSGGALTGKLVFYDFSSMDSDDGHVSGEMEYTDAIFPEIYFLSSGEVAAVGDNGFAVIRDLKNPTERKRVVLDREIVSVFHDRENIGFIMHSTETDCKYDLEVYHYNGRKAMSTSFDFEFQDVRMEDGEILLYDASSINVYRTSGKQKVALDYEREVHYFAPISGYHRYLVVTVSSMDQIQVR
ncbi:MAG: DUF5711 family protein [Lachnospiraceae bacterium]|nr:DUF5711 family protein [Lachnospiraceae bacterium]